MLRFLLLVATVPVATLAQTEVRVATWNLQTIGPPGTTEYEAALAVLGRVGADVVGINEVGSSADVGYLTSLANDAGYPHVFVASRGGPFGAQRNAFLASTWPIARAVQHDSASLSGDPEANDLTRDFLEIELALPDGVAPLVLLVQHWKSGTANSDEFRRAVETTRIRQAVGVLGAGLPAYVVMGDVNEEADSVPGSPTVFTEAPLDLPASYVLGADLQAMLASSGLPNDPFAPLVDHGMTILDALQLDGSDATRPGSGRRLDYIFASEVLAATAVAEVYDSADEILGGGLPKYGTAPPATVSVDASDHFLVFTDLVVPAHDCGGECPPPACNGDGVCDAGEDCTTCPGECESGAGASCGDGVCSVDEGEDCLSCAVDCAGRQGGRPAGRFCCGYGGEGAVGCADARCAADGFACQTGPVDAWCCGDGTCSGGEDGSLCEVDCGAAPPPPPPPPPTCDGDGVCEAGEDCSNCAADCAGITGGKPANRFCCGDGALEAAEGDGSVCDGNP